MDYSPEFNDADPANAIPTTTVIASPIILEIGRFMLLIKYVNF